MAAKKKPRRGGHGRPKGMRVVFCKGEKCKRRITGFPGEKISCPACATVNTIPQ